MTKTLPRENIVLRRLYFDAMHRREDAVENAESGTFTWMLEEIEHGNDAVEGDGEDEDKSSSASRSRSVRSDEDRAKVLDNDGNDVKSTTGVASSDIPNIPDAEQERRRRTSQALTSFLRNENGIFFICGKAGSGKSTMMKFLFRDRRVRHQLELWAGDKKLVLVNFFFWNSGDKLQMSLEGFYRSLLFETVKQCPEPIRQVFRDEWMHSAVPIQSPFRLPELKLAFERN
ncbi:hypothetical protein VTN77DRAFT_2544 [Rasamsonia byssochlamydoides]|uniref:uncharacterized protein n=1 Tax=Rasamsonia byssochlamydoides TaxID=89139 RepID=UPI003742E6F8